MSSGVFIIIRFKSMVLVSIECNSLSRWNGYYNTIVTVLFSLTKYVENIKQRRSSEFYSKKVTAVRFKK